MLKIKFIVPLIIFMFCFNASGQVFMAGQPSLRKTEAGIDTLIKKIVKTIELSDSANKLAKYNVEILGGLITLYNQGQELANKNLELSQRLIKITDESKKSIVAMEKFTKQLVTLEGENIKTQQNLDSLTHQLVKFTSENAKLSGRLVQFATDNERSSKQMNFLTWVMCGFGLIQLIEIVARWFSRKNR